jgi:ABC-type sugar transport system ATPase subunit
MTPGAQCLVAEDLARRFGETRALISCSFDVRVGEVHALVGENGSGKSTLVKILSGVLEPNRGSLTVQDSKLSRIVSPRHAADLGIVTVFQEILVVDELSVLDNIWLGYDGIVRSRLPRGLKRQRAAEVLARLTTDYPSLDTPAKRLNLGQRQLAVIARALVREPRILILDEATSALDVADRDRLFAEIRQSCASGTAVLFISHRMEEIFEIAARVTVLRSGESVATLERQDTDSATLVRLMSDRELKEVMKAQEQPLLPDSPVLLRAAALALRPGAQSFDFDLRAGEIVGIAGLEGHGQDEFVRTLAGLVPPVAGHVLIEPAGRPIRSAADASDAAIEYVPRNRKAEGIYETLSISENFAMPTLRLDRRWGLLSRRLSHQRFAPYREQLKIRLGRESNPITTLSGGTQQKVLIARRLAARPRVLILNDPTRGVDLGTKQDIYEFLRNLSRENIAVVILSTELEEHVLLARRVVVFREGTLSEELTSQQLTRPRLVAALFGQALPEEDVNQSSRDGGSSGQAQHLRHPNGRPEKSAHGRQCSSD